MSDTPKPPPLTDFWHDLPREGKWLLSTIILDFIGTGLVLPFSVVYLHEVRDIQLSTVGVLLGIPAVVGLLLVAPAGALMDRVGARRLVVAALAVQVVAEVLMSQVHGPGMAAIALTMLGVASAAMWPGFNTLIATIMPTSVRQRYFGVSFAMVNVGIGIGGVAGGLLVDVERPATFVAIYLINGLTFLAPLAVMLGPLRRVNGVPEAPADDEHESVAPSYASLLRDRALRPVLVLAFVAGFVGYAQLNVGMPAFARAEGGVSTQALGVAYAVNTALIVVLQLVVLQRIEGKRRTRVLIAMSVIWAVAWLSLGASGMAAGTVVAAVLLCVCFGVFGLGETLYQPTVPAMVNDLAPAGAMGRYNAALTASFQLSGLVGPVVSGLLIGHGLSTVYIVVMVVGCAMVAGLTRQVERRISLQANGARADRDGVVLSV
ncbi:MFS transporter [Luteipulveratus mongoliensis]|uniref:Major facilitator superfamily (MFS) profile domain-containing protein n=1 Tax=Luteipulveratus mongoliensis TaxID=571913 RepID=A0A0K1JHY1_9MICO|nr:MFS transporter [Luteipulveratus mongoliensis]AKU16322.1 hypothetical protein VV02_11370 [Luteipulveratus mongoliensis]